MFCLCIPAWWDSSPHGGTGRSDGSGSLFAEEWSVGGCHGQGESAVASSELITAFLLFITNKHISSTGLHTHTYGSCRPLSSGFCVSSFFSPILLKFVQPFHPSTTGGPDSPPHCIPFGKNWYCPVAAAAHGSSRCSHHQRLHPPPHFSQGGPGRDCCRAAGGWSLTFTGHEGEQRIEHDAQRLRHASSNKHILDPYIGSQISS